MAESLDGDHVYVVHGDIQPDGDGFFITGYEYKIDITAPYIRYGCREFENIYSTIILRGSEFDRSSASINSFASLSSRARSDDDCRRMYATPRPEPGGFTSEVKMDLFSDDPGFLPTIEERVGSIAGAYVSDTAGQIRWLGPDTNWAGSMNQPVERCNAEEALICLRFPVPLILPDDINTEIHFIDSVEVRIAFDNNYDNACRSPFIIVHNDTESFQSTYIFSKNLGLVRFEWHYKHDEGAYQKYGATVVGGTPINFHTIACETP